MELKGHLLYYPEGKHDINLDDYVQKSQLNDALKSKVDSITKTTYTDLKNLRDNSQLVPGSLYRITDYQCTTTQENTQSAGHQFDIVLLALSENKLAEEGWAMMHDNIYDVTFADGVTKKCYIYCTSVAHNEWNIVDCETLLGVGGFTEGDGEDFVINENNKSAISVEDSEILNQENIPYNYFQNSNLSAWKVWYCLDNDKDRFAWADDSVDEDSPASISFIFDGAVFNCLRHTDGDSGENHPFGWITEDEAVVCTDTQIPNIGDNIYDGPGSLGQVIGTVSSYTPAHEGTNLPNGRGVIYRLIDEFNNDVAYDFKNIQYLVKLTDGIYDNNGTDEWCYTFNAGTDDNEGLQDASLMNGIYDTLADNEHGCYNNKITNYLRGFSDTLYILPGIICALYYLNGDSTIECADNNFLHCSNTICSGFLTSCDFKSTNNLKIENAFVCTFIKCGVTFNSNVTTPNIYIKNKKVLTES